jgi:hypothetical protein
VVSAGSLARIASTIQVGVKRVSKLNPQNWVSFEVNHCVGAVSLPDAIAARLRSAIEGEPEESA